MDKYYLSKENILFLMKMIKNNVKTATDEETSEMLNEIFFSSNIEENININKIATDDEVTEMLNEVFCLS